MKMNNCIKCLIIIGILCIVIAFLLWREFSFILGGFGIVLIGISGMLYLHKK